MTNKQLLSAVQCGETDAVRRGLEEGCDANYCDREGYSLVQWAAQENHLEIVKLLSQHGADLNAACESGTTALTNSVGDGNLEMVKLLVDLGADVNQVPQAGSALHMAIAYGHQAIAEYLMEMKANVNAADDDGQTPLFLAAMYCHTEGAQLLLSKGADKNIMSKEGKRAIDVIGHELEMPNSREFVNECQKMIELLS